MLVIISYFIEKGVLDSYIELIGEYTLQLRIKNSTWWFYEILEYIMKYSGFPDQLVMTLF